MVLSVLRAIFRLILQQIWFFHHLHFTKEEVRFQMVKVQLRHGYSDRYCYLVVGRGGNGNTCGGTGLREWAGALPIG